MPTKSHLEWRNHAKVSKSDEFHVILDFRVFSHLLAESPSSNGGELVVRPGLKPAGGQIPGYSTLAGRREAAQMVILSAFARG